MKLPNFFSKIKEKFEPKTEIQNEILNLEKDVKEVRKIVEKIEKRVAKLKDIAWDKVSKKEAKDMYKILQEKKETTKIQSNIGEILVNKDFMDKEKKKHLDDPKKCGMITTEEMLSFPKVAKNVEPEFSKKHQGKVWSVEASDGNKIVYGERTWDNQSHLLTAHSKTENNERKKQDRVNGVGFTEQFIDRDCNNNPAFNRSISNNSKKGNEISQKELDDIGKLTSEAVKKVLKDKEKYPQNTKNKDKSNEQ